MTHGQFNLALHDQTGRVLGKQTVKNTLNWDARDIVLKRMFFDTAGSYDTLRYYLGVDNRRVGGSSTNPIYHLVAANQDDPADNMYTLYNSEDYLGYFGTLCDFDTNYRRYHVTPTISQSGGMWKVTASAVYQNKISSDEISNWIWSELCDADEATPWKEILAEGNPQYGQNIVARQRHWEALVGYPWQRPSICPEGAFGDDWDTWNSWDQYMNHDAYAAFWMPVAMLCFMAWQGVGSLSWPYTETYTDDDWFLLASAPLERPIWVMPGQYLSVLFQAYLGGD